MVNNKLRSFLLGLGFLALTACSTRAIHPTVVYEAGNPLPSSGTQVPEGAARYVWDEPMVDVIDVPPGLDPDGVYYRPAHKEVVEIRQGRWQYYNGQ